MKDQNHEGISGEAEKTSAILLVDDEQSILRSLKRVLRHEPYNVLTASSGTEGLKVLESEQVQMIVSDQRMPGMNGVDFLEKARKMYPDTIRVLLTGYSDLKTAEEAINRGEIYRFMNKPWNDEDLKATILQGLKKWHLERENIRLFKTIKQQNLELKEWNEKLEHKVEERTRALKEAQGQLIQSEKMASLGILAGGVAHEINNPLGGILGIAQVLLMENPDDEKLAEDLKTIEQATLHCSEIIKNLLSFSRKTDPKSREPVIFTYLIDQVLALFGHLFRQSNIKVNIDFAADFPGLKVNSKHVQQVLANLLVNAQQAMVRDGEIYIRGRTVSSGEVLVEIEDQGGGIPESILDKIFDPFFTTKEEGEGTGLGLSVCYRIMQDHGGRIEVETEEGKSTCMKLIFPGSAVLGGGQTVTPDILDQAHAGGNY